MPTPRTPPYVDEILTALATLEASVAALAEDQERIANFQRLMYESWFGADANSSGIWDGSDRYPDV